MNEQKDSASEGVSEAVPELKLCPFCGTTPQGLNKTAYDNPSFYSVVCNGCCSIAMGETPHKVIARWNARVHQLPEDKKSGEMQTKASSHSQIVIDKYNSLEADLAAIKERIECDYSSVPLVDEHNVVLADLKLLLGMLNLKTEFWQNAEKETDELRANTSKESKLSESDISLTLAEIRERRAKLSQIVYTECTKPDDYKFTVNAPSDIDALLSIIDTLQVANENLRKNYARVADLYVKAADRPITQDGASASALAQDAPDKSSVQHEPESSESKSVVTVDEAAQEILKLVAFHAGIEYPQPEYSTRLPLQSTIAAIISKHTELSVHQPDVQAADALAMFREAYGTVVYLGGSTIDIAVDSDLAKALLAASPVQPEVSKEQTNAEGK